MNLGIGLLRSGFFWSLLLVLSVLGFFVMSVDRAHVDQVTIVGGLEEAQLMDVKRTLDSLDSRANSSANVRHVVDALPWVHHANVRKVWPGGISVEVLPEQVIAYWNDNAFINDEGKILVTDLLKGGDVPHLYGPAGTESEVMARYQQMNPVLQTSGHEIQVLSRSARGAWTIETRAKLEILLGKEDLKARLERFLIVSRRLEGSDLDEVVKRMDARYINGVAVHFTNEVELADINKSVGEHRL